jgi:putative component of toxin-antitoxin plasmid stabilization module
MQRGAIMVVLLAGGDKRTQSADVERALAIAAEWKD